MEPDILQNKIDKHTDEIHTLAVTVTELAGIVKSNETRYADSQQDLRSLSSGIKELNEKFTNVMSLADKVMQLKEDIVELKSDRRADRHSIGNLQTAQQSIPIHAEKLAAMGAKLAEMEKRENKIDGAGSVLKTIGGYAIAPALLLLYWIVSQYIQANPSKGGFE